MYRVPHGLLVYNKFSKLNISLIMLFLQGPRKRALPFGSRTDVENVHPMPDDDLAASLDGDDASDRPLSNVEVEVSKIRSSNITC